MRPALRLIYISFLWQLTFCTADTLATDRDYSGTICDSESHQPIENAYIRISSGQVIAEADSVGNFTFRNQGSNPFEILISMLGYKSAVVEVVPGLDQLTQHIDTVFLEVAPLTAEGIVIRATADRFRGASSANTVILSSSYVEQVPRSNLDPLRLVQTQPAVHTSNDFRSDLIVRGGNPSETAMLIDGFDMSNMSHFGTQGSTGGFSAILPADNISEIHFSPGGFSVRYPNRLSSVTEIRTKTANETINQTIFRLDMTGLFASIIVSDGDRYLMSSVRRSFIDVVKDQLNLPSTPIFGDAFLKGKLPLGSAATLTLIALGGYDRFSIPLGDLPYDDGGLDYRGDRTLFGLSMISSSNPSSSTEIRYSNSYADFDVAYGNKSTPDLYSNRSIERSNKISLDYSLSHSKAGVLLLGASEEIISADFDLSIVNYRDDFGDRHRGMKVDTEMDYNRAGAYAEFGSSIASLLDISLGLRFDYNSFLDRGLVSPRIACKSALSDRLSFSAGYGLYGQDPSPLWLASDPSNQTLPYFKATHLTAGISYSNEPELSVRLEGYLKRYLNYPVAAWDTIRTMVDWGTDYAFYDTRAISADGRGFARGIESVVRCQPAPDLRISLAASISKSKFRGVSCGELPGSFDTEYSLAASASFLPRSWMQIGMSFAREGGRPHTPVDTALSRRYSYTVYDKSRTNSARYPAYQKLDISLTLVWSVGGVNIRNYFSILNALNAGNVYF